MLLVLAGMQPGYALQTECPLTQEAEAGTLVGFEIGSDSIASGGSYIYTTENGNSYDEPASDQYAEYCFDVAEAGPYQIVGYVYALTPLDDSFWVQINGGEPFIWDLLRNDRYDADAISNRRDRLDPVVLNIPAGRITLRISAREANARLDRLEVIPSTVELARDEEAVSIDNLAVAQNAANTVIDLAAAFAPTRDIGTDRSFSLVGNSNPALFTNALIDGDSLILDYAEGAAGLSNLVVRATDAEGRFIEVGFSVIVGEGMNTVPLALPIADISVVGTAQPTRIDLTPIFSDADGDSLQFNVTQISTPELFNAISIEGTTLVLAYANRSGEALVTVRATDAAGSFAETTFRVTVQAVNLVAGRVTDNLLALYTFDEGTGNVVHDVSEAGEPLDLTIESPDAVRWERSALTLSDSALIATADPASKLYESITASGSFTVEAWLTPGSLEQDGPARIVTYSIDRSNSNFTLGQGIGGDTNPSNQFSARVHTTNTDPVGLPLTATGAGTLTMELIHVVMTYADGITRVYLDGVLVQEFAVGGQLSWDASHRFGLGNEFDAPRPWLGTYHIVAVYDRALNETEVLQNYEAGIGVSSETITRVTVRQPVNRVAGRVTDDLLTLYTFDEGAGNVVHDVSEVGEPLDLNIGSPNAVRWEQSALTLTNPVLIASPAPATKLYESISASGSFTVEAWLTPVSLELDGPARIITYSLDRYDGNFTLGQGIGGNTNPSNQFSARVRTTNTDSVGLPLTASGDGTLTTALTHVVMTHAEGVTRIYLDGVLVQEFAVGGEFNWDASYRFALGNEFDAPRSWLGTYHMVAVYSRALGETEVLQNYEAGIGVDAAP